MAVLSCLPGLKVNIKVNGELAKEYDAPLDDVKASSEKYEFYKLSSRAGEESPYALTYIESKLGEEFELAIDSTGLGFPDSHRQIILRATIDNWSPPSQMILNQVQTYSSTFIGSNLAGWKKIRFGFSALDSVETPVSEKDIKKQIEEANKYGTIVVKLELAHIMGAPTTGGASVAPPKTPVEKVAEKVLKGRAVDSRATFKSEPATAPTFYSVNYADPLRRPFAVFEFRYRTMEGLIREFIVPRPEEVINVEEEYMRIKRVKPESAAEPRGIKREPVDAALLAARYKQRRMEDGKVEIDLTDD